MEGGWKGAVVRGGAGAGRGCGKGSRSELLPPFSRGTWRAPPSARAPEPSGRRGAGSGAPGAGTTGCTDETEGAGEGAEPA